jgi:hypothetical protein
METATNSKQANQQDQADGMGLGASRKTKSNCGSRPNLRVATAYREPLGENT